MIVVSNSSPLIALSRIGRLDILASFYKRILVPAEVHHEVTVAGRDLPGAGEVRNALWIDVVPQRSPTDPLLEASLPGPRRWRAPAAVLLAKSLPSRPCPFG